MEDQDRQDHLKARLQTWWDSADSRLFRNYLQAQLKAGVETMLTVDPADVSRIASVQAKSQVFRFLLREELIDEIVRCNS